MFCTISSGSSLFDKVLVYMFPVYNTLTLNTLMDSSFWFDTINLGRSIVYMERLQVMISKYNCIFYSEDMFILTNCVNPYEMLHCVAFHVCLYCLQKNTSHEGVTSIQRAYNKI